MTSSWAPNCGVPHPTGGYDDVEYFEDGRHYRRADGTHHRLDGPAIEGKNLEEWYVDNLLHRVDGPATIATEEDGVVVKEWFLHGRPHRIGGPQTGRPDEDFWLYYVHGEEVSKDEHDTIAAAVQDGKSEGDALAEVLAAR